MSHQRFWRTETIWAGEANSAPALSWTTGETTNGGSAPRLTHAEQAQQNLAGLVIPTRNAAERSGLQAVIKGVYDDLDKSAEIERLAREVVAKSIGRCDGKRTPCTICRLRALVQP